MHRSWRSICFNCQIAFQDFEEFLLMNVIESLERLSTDDSEFDEEYDDEFLDLERFGELYR